MTTSTELDAMIDDALAEGVPHEVLAYAEQPFLDGVVGGEPRPAEEPPAWEIDGERTAEWVARRLREWSADVARAEELARLERERIDAYLDRVRARSAGHIEWASARLRAYHRGILAERPKAKTIDLPSGQLKDQAGGVSAKVTDAGALTEWLEDHDGADCLDYPDPKPKLAKLKKRYGDKVADEAGAYPAMDPATGEVIPGVHIERGAPTGTYVVAETGEAIRLVERAGPGTGEASPGTGGEAEPDAEAYPDGVEIMPDDDVRPLTAAEAEAMFAAADDARANAE